MSDDDLQDCDQVNNKTLHIFETAPWTKIYEFCTISKKLNEIYTAKLCANRLKYKFPLKHYSRLKFDVFFPLYPYFIYIWICINMYVWKKPWVTSLSLSLLNKSESWILFVFYILTSRYFPLGIYFKQVPSNLLNCYSCIVNYTFQFYNGDISDSPENLSQDIQRKSTFSNDSTHSS